MVVVGSGVCVWGGGFSDAGGFSGVGEPDA
jgi:hypothetical protein